MITFEMPKVTTARLRRLKAWQVKRMKAALAEARSGAPGVPHEEVVRWIESWDTANERRRPRPRTTK